MIAGPDVRDVLCGDLVRDDFAGPGGWDEGLRLLGLRNVYGIELDPTACATAVAAGHRRVCSNVYTVLSEAWAGIDGYVASPPCTTFSLAGLGGGRSVTDLLVAGLRAMAEPGADPRPQLAVDVYRALVRPLWAKRVATYRAALEGKRLAKAKRPTKAGTELAARQMAATTILVLEPVRVVRDLRPRWVALEQVPPVLPLWHVIAGILRGWGYSVSVGVVNAADIGVPQTRERAFLVARSDGPAVLPSATHAPRAEETLFGTVRKWVSMAEALGWTGRMPDMAGGPAKSVCGDRGPRWAYEDGDGTHGRNLTIRTGANGMKHSRSNDDVEPYERSVDEPAPTVDRKTGAAWKVAPEGEHIDPPMGWKVNTGRDWKPGGTREDAQQFDPAEQPAPAIDTKGRWHVRTGNYTSSAAPGDDPQREGNGRYERPPDEPAPTVGSRADQWEVEAEDPADVVLGTGFHSRGYDRSTPRTADQPAPTLSFGHDSARWAWERPSTVVAGSNPGIVFPNGGGPDVSMSERGYFPWGEDSTTIDELTEAVEDLARDVDALHHDIAEEDPEHWSHSRPSTTIVGSFNPDVVAPPGWRMDPLKPRQDTPGSVRISPQQAAVLQSFPADYPWQGNKTKVFEQIGNAVPPRMAAAVVGALLGLDWPTLVDT